MKSTKLTSLLITLVLAAVGFFILPFVSESLAASANIFAAGIVLGGVAITLLAPSASSAATDEEDRQTLYVGNLPYRANEAIVRELFEKFGSVYSVRLVKDKQTGRRRGFGFVTMNTQGASSAMAKLNDEEFQERVLKVREAKEKSSQDNPSQSAE